MQAVSETELDFSARLFACQNIPTFILRPPYEQDRAKIDGELRKRFFPGESYPQIVAWIRKNCTFGSIYLLEDFMHLSSVVVPISDEAYFVAAPFSFEKMQVDENMKIDDPQLLQSFFDEIPKVASRDQFQSTICTIFTHLLQVPLTFTYHYFSKESDFLYSAEQPTPEELERHAELIKNRYEVENRMLECVRAGDADGAILAHQKMTQFSFAPRTPNSLRNSKNFVIVFNTLMRKAVESKGVNTLYIDEISRNYAIAIEECTSQLQLNDLSVRMIKGYCAQVNAHAVRDYGELIQRCITYINFHSTQQLSLQSMADALHVNASYLSAQFTKETGCTLTSYLNKTRIEHALPLLAEKNRSIENIANSCGFEDMNYFTRVFKKITGVSPSAYRRNL